MAGFQEVTSKKGWRL